MDRIDMKMASCHRLSQRSAPPQRFVAGADAIEAAEAKARELLAQAEASRELGDSLAYDEAQV